LKVQQQLIQETMQLNYLQKSSQIFLYLGNEHNSATMEHLESKSITHIINITEEIPNTFEGHWKFQYLRIEFPDNEKGYIPNVIDEAFQFIDNAKNNNGKVLVHCRLGVSRSASLVIAYLLRTLTDKTLKEIYSDVLIKRPIVKPNPSFIKQLMHLEKKWRNIPTSTVSGPIEIWGQKQMNIMKWRYYYGEEEF